MDPKTQQNKSTADRSKIREYETSQMILRNFIELCRRAGDLIRFSDLLTVLAMSFLTVSLAV